MRKTELCARGSDEKASSKGITITDAAFVDTYFSLQDSLKPCFTLEQFSRVTHGKNYRLHHQNLHKIVWRLTEFCTAVYQDVSTS